MMYQKLNMSVLVCHTAIIHHILIKDVDVKFKLRMTSKIQQLVNYCFPNTFTTMFLVIYTNTDTTNRIISPATRSINIPLATYRPVFH